MEASLRDPIRSLSLAERTRLAGSPSVEVAESAEALRLLQWWERTYFAGQPSLFSRRLRANGLNRGTVLPLLVPAGGEVDALPRPMVAMLDRVGSTPTPGPADPVAAGLEPFIGWAWDRVDEAVDALEAPPGALTVDREAIESQFRDHLGQRLFAIAVRVFIVRLHVARRRGLTGETPKSRFEAWARAELADGPALARLLDEFPVLARSLASEASGGASAWAEMLSRLDADGRALGLEHDRLVAVHAGLGDTHNGGRTVLRVTMASGTELFYKPRSMAVDAHTQDLIRWLNDHGLEPALRTVGVVDRGEYGWMEPVLATPCATPEDVASFYRRQGALLLVLYLLDGSDIHCENIVAAGAHPVLVDLETMFQAPALTGAGRNMSSETVLGTMFLPGRASGVMKALDGGGMSQLAGQEAPTITCVVGLGSDEMRVELLPVELKGHDNVPHLDGRPAPAGDHVDDIVSGFTDAYRLVLRHRDAMLAPDGPIAAFRSDRVRHILRGTEEYAVLLRGSFHPSCLRDAVRRDFVFDTLWLGTLHQPHTERLIASEREDLVDGDVPYFTASVDSRHLTDSRGRVIEDFLATSGLDRAVHRIMAMDEGDLVRQVACVRGSFAAVSGALPITLPYEAGARRESTPAELVAAATAIGEELAQLAFVRDGEAHWTGLIPLPDQGSEYRMIGPDLYEGTAGIALFLAYLARATDRSDFADLARAAYAGAARRFMSPSGDRSIGAFTGGSGLVYTALHLAAVFEEPAPLIDADPLLRSIARGVRRDRTFDVLDGSAGCILVMLRLAERHPSTEALAVAKACGRHIVRNGVALDGGLAWPPGPDGGRPLLGLGHGAGGVAAALAQLALVAADPRLARCARRALAYERAHFVPEVANWPDLRGDDGSDSRPARFGWAWCHGAPGIGMARLMTPLDPSEQLRDDVATAVASTEMHGFGGLHNLCHGDLGNAELLLLAGRRQCGLGRAHAVLEHHRHAGTWLCGTPGSVAPPGLMTGIAGIGYQLLRLADPEAVPSLLTLEGPP